MNRKKLKRRRRIIRNRIILFAVIAALILLIVVMAVRAISQSENDRQTQNAIRSQTEYQGNIRSVVNDNIPNFTDDEKTDKTYVRFGKTDSKGRCTKAEACISYETVTKAERAGDKRKDIIPSGWRSGSGLQKGQLISWPLTGETSEVGNRVAVTKALEEAKNSYEKKISDYLRDHAGNHVIVRVTADFQGSNQLASGIHMEAMSVEDEGKGISFNLYFHNVQPGKKIVYSTGAVTNEDQVKEKKKEYVVDSNTNKFHKEDCPEVSGSSAKTVTATRSELIKQGYSPCGECEP